MSQDLGKKSANKKKKQARTQRLNRIAKKLAERAGKRRTAQNKLRIFKRHVRKRARKKRLIAYDFETTRIAVGTPSPRYITAYGEGMELSLPCNDMFQVRDILIKHFLTADNNRTRFVAWNGNRFDCYFIAGALLHSDEFIMRPYLTRSNALRGLKVLPRDPVLAKSVHWEFVDGMAMLGMPGRPLKSFLEKFAPDFGKLEGPNFEYEEFDANNAQHVEYAERDSEGLYHAMMNAQELVIEHFHIGLTATIGNMGIKILQSFIPEEVIIKEPRHEVKKIISEYVMRGGYCHSVKPYTGPTWKYDLNQAYAAAMRDARLPCGRIYHTEKINPYALTYIVRCEGENPNGKIPFYYREIDGDRAIFSGVKLLPTWITSIEYEQLLREGWRLKAHESFFWDESFDLREYVNRLEHLRINAPGGPSSAQGEMMKSIGNNSYGKTVENLDAQEILISRERPDERFTDFFMEDESLSHIWFRLLGDTPVRDYHQPQLGAFITAHVRMVVRRAALKNPDAWIYADTDCVAFSEYVPLKVDAKKYGAWKIESNGEEYIFLGKKVYAKKDFSEVHAKGLVKKKITEFDFLEWAKGTPPVQEQIQKNNFVKVMSGTEMFRKQIRKGTKIVDFKEIF